MHEAPFPSTVPWLFFRREQLAAGTSHVIYSFILTSKVTGGILAVFHCLPGSTHWISPPAAPFGGILPLDGCSRPHLLFLLACIRDWVRRQGGRSVTIKTAPSCYAPVTHQLCHECYLDSGFLPNHTYSDRYIPIGNEDFEQIIEPPERRRLSKGKKAGLQTRCETGKCTEWARAFLQHCHAAHGYPTSLDNLVALTAVNPENYMVLSAWLGSRPVAAAVLVRVSDHVLYHYASGYLPECRSLSPPLMLFEAAYGYARREGMAILDLGISLDHHGHAKPSLSRFKARIGGKECRKIVYKACF